MKKGQSRGHAPGVLRLLAGSCFAALAALSQPAMAQNESAPQQGDAQSDQGGIQDIVVTARYITENIQDTPMAISAQTSDQLQAANVDNVATLGAVVPNLYTHPGDQQAAGSPMIVMRGVLQGATASYAVAPAVAIYVDDVYHPTVVGSELDLSDIDHVEVNRGPQSTLSGNASIGGSIKIYTRDPQGDNSGNVAFTAGSFKKMGASGAIDLGLTDTLAMRVTGSFERQNGYVDMLDFTCEMKRRGTPELAGTFPEFQPDSLNRGCKIGELGGENKAAGQVKLRWRPNDKLDAMIWASYSRQDDQETPELLVSVTNPDPNPTSIIQDYNNAVESQFGIRYDDRFLPPADNPYSTYSTYCRPLLPANLQSEGFAPTPSGFCYPNDRKQDKLTIAGRVKYKLTDDVNATAIASYANYGNEFTQNADSSPLGYVISHFSQRVKAKTGELRFDGKLLDGRLDWVVGGFILRYDGHLGGLIGYITNNFLQDDYAHIESQSGFFHLDFSITDRWRISGGARYTDGSVRYSIDHPPLIVVPQPFTSTQKRWDWLISTDYKITDDILAYANVATGSRPAGVTTIVFTPQQLQATPGEELVSYEAGLKMDFFDRRLRTNLAGFYTDYSSLSASQAGVQCLGQLPDATWYPSADSCVQLYPDNPAAIPFYISAGKPATIKGFEWEITAIPVDGLRLDWSGGYNKFTSGVKTPGAPGYLAPGNHRQPEWNMHANISYDIETSAGTFTPRLDWNWQSQQDFDLASGARPPLPEFIIKPYGLWNAQLSYKSPDNDWTATLSVTNLFDKFHFYQLFAGTGFNTASNVGPPREFSLTVRRNF